MKYRVSPKAIMRSTDADILLITDMTNILYLTGVRITAGIVAVTPEKIRLFTDARYSEKAQKHAYDGVQLSSYDELDALVHTKRSIAYEAQHISVERMERWTARFKNKKFVQYKDGIHTFRRKKGLDEKKNIEKSCAITRKILRDIPSLLENLAMTEKELAWNIEEKAHAYGADGLSFPAIVGFGSHTAIPHHEPTKRKLGNSSIVQIDCGVFYNGYASDYSRVYIRDHNNSEMKKVLRALKEAKKSAEDLLSPGISNHALDNAARTVLDSYDLGAYFPHALGHGLGLEIHEGITLSSRAPETTLLKDEAVTIEPGVYFPGKWGMRIEDTYIVK